MKFKILSIIAVALALSFTSCKSSHPSFDDSSDISQSEESEDQSVESEPVVQPKKGPQFYRRMLDAFLMIYYPKQWSLTTSYIPNTVSISSREDVTKIDTNTDEIRGTIKIKNMIKERERKFMAIVKDDGDGNYRVYFSRLHWVDNEWLGIPTTPFEYVDY